MLRRVEEWLHRIEDIVDSLHIYMILVEWCQCVPPMMSMVERQIESDDVL